jgi:DNA-binding transcriptional ArsR family regulator
MDRDAAVSALASLAHDNRLSIFRLVVKRGASGMRAGDIARQVGLGATNASFHLNELARSGLLRLRREGRYVCYSVDIDAMRKLLRYLIEDCCQADMSFVTKLSEPRPSAAD